MKSLLHIRHSLTSNKARAINPERFGDPMALKTSWEPLRKGGSNFRTHKLIAQGNRFEFSQSTQFRFFSFGLIGAGLLCFLLFFRPTSILDGFEESANFILPLIFLFIFSGAGILFLKYGAIPAVFDRDQGYFWRGGISPRQVKDVSQIKVALELSAIHALQLLTKRIHGSESSFCCYELNIVDSDGNRLDVVDHGSFYVIKEDAARLAEFLGVPLWDAT